MQKLKPVSFAATQRRQHMAGEGAERTQSTQLVKRSGPPVPWRLVQWHYIVLFCIFFPHSSRQSLFFHKWLGLKFKTKDTVDIPIKLETKKEMAWCSSVCFHLWILIKIKLLKSWGLAWTLKWQPNILNGQQQQKHSIRAFYCHLASLLQKPQTKMALHPWGQFPQR